MPDPWVVALALVGPVAVAGAWLVVRSGRVTVWAAMGTTLGMLGLLSLATGAPPASTELGPWWDLVIGLMAGVALYGATAAFLAVAGGWPLLARHAAELYGRRRGMSLGRALGISVAITAPGEELLWRGVVLVALGYVFAPWTAAALAWSAYVAANAVSGSVPIVLGAVVGGAAWTGLAVWTGGVVAGIACHVVWTGLMIVLPPVPGARP
jgi:membrane protease YdiL (CAAX protease family)